MLFFNISSLFFDFAEVKRDHSQSNIALAVGFVTTLIFNYFLVTKGGMMLRGIGWSATIGLFFQLLTIVALNWKKTFGNEKAISMFSKTTFIGIGSRFVASLKSCILNLWSMWAFEYCILVASYISSYAFAAQIVLLQITLIFLVVPFGFAMVGNDLIAESIQYYAHEEAKATSVVMQQFAIGVAIVMIILQLALRNTLFRLYTSDQHVIDMLNSVWVPFSVFMFCLAVNLIVAGALQPVGYSVNHLIYGFTQNAYWILAVPTVYIGVFGFDETLKALWICLAIFTMIVAPVTFFLLRSIDFKQVVEAKMVVDEERVQKEQSMIQKEQDMNLAINL